MGFRMLVLGLGRAPGGVLGELVLWFLLLSFLVSFLNLGGGVKDVSQVDGRFIYGHCLISRLSLTFCSLFIFLICTICTTVLYWAVDQHRFCILCVCTGRLVKNKAAVDLCHCLATSKIKFAKYHYSITKITTR